MFAFLLQCKDVCLGSSAPVYRFDSQEVKLRQFCHVEHTMNFGATKAMSKPSVNLLVQEVTSFKVMSKIRTFYG